jgi:teichoic acid transport system permease protein
MGHQEGNAAMTATSLARDAEFEPVYHHYGPHRAGDVPPLIPYFRELWYRRAFAAEMSRATMRSANTSTFFGQAWLIINPMLLAAVYYILVTIIRRQHDPAFFAHLTLGLFAVQLVGTSVTSRATSITSSGLLLNLLPGHLELPAVLRADLAVICPRSCGHQNTSSADSLDRS